MNNHSDLASQNPRTADESRFPPIDRASDSQDTGRNAYSRFRTTGRLTGALVTGGLEGMAGLYGDRDNSEYAELYRQLPSVVVRALYLNGFRSARQVAETPDELLRSLRQIGPERLRIIREAIPYHPATLTSGSLRASMIPGEAEEEQPTPVPSPPNRITTGSLTLARESLSPEERIKQLETRVAALEQIIDLLVARRDALKGRQRDRRITTLSGEDFLGQIESSPDE